MKFARNRAAQCGAMAAAALLSFRPLLAGLQLPGAGRTLSGLALLAILATVVLALRARSPAPAADPSAPADPFAARPARRLALAAQTLAGIGVLASLVVRLRESGLATPALFWLSALAVATLAAWLCVHLRATLVRARFFWALALGILLAVLSSLERPDALAQPLTGLQRLEPGPGVNIVLGVGAVLLGEGHPGAELFALVPTYAPASSAVEPRVPWFRHLSALAACLLVGLLVFGLRHSGLGLRGSALASALFATAALGFVAAPLLVLRGFPAAFDGVALWLLAGSASLFAPKRVEEHH